MGADYETALFSFYRYYPSLAAAIIFTLIFFASSAYHGYQLYRRKTYFFIPFLIGGVLEVIGYVGRAASSQQSPDWTIGPYLVQNLCLLIAPAFLAASIYMELGRIIMITGGEEHSIIRRTILTKLFVFGDVLSFLIQSNGGGLMASGGLDLLKIGEKIVIGGLMVQIVFFGLFIITTIIFDCRLRAKPSYRSLAIDARWKRHLIILYITSTFILIRSVFRVIEYAQGFNGYLISHEAFLYVFDGVLMAIVMVILNVHHPGELSPLLESLKSSNQSGELRDLASPPV